ncbi:unnamed protein product [Rhodiola kirilowii]
MSFRRLLTVRQLYRSARIQEPSSHLLGSTLSLSNGLFNDPTSNCKTFSSFYSGSKPSYLMLGGTNTLRSTMDDSSLLDMIGARTYSTQTQTQPPANARSMGAVRLSVLSPGIIYEPYAPREKIPFWKRWFTKSGWKQTKEDIIIELKSAYAIAKLRKTGYSKQKFYVEAFDLYKEINTMLANGDKNSLRKAVTEKMFSTLKNEIKQREARWSAVHWEVIEPAVRIRTLRARLIGVDPKDLSKLFIQLTLEFLTKQKFEAYDSKGAVVAGDKNKEVLVREIWVFEKSMFHKGAFWRLCGRIPVQPNPSSQPKSV